VSNHASGYYPAKDDKWTWVVKFHMPFALDMDYLGEVGEWIAENVENGCEMIMPRSYYFATEEDALLVYLRFK
jgi:hypothetical protein